MHPKIKNINDLVIGGQVVTLGVTKSVLNNSWMLFTLLHRHGVGRVLIKSQLLGSEKCGLHKRTNLNLKQKLLSSRHSRQTQHLNNKPTILQKDGFPQALGLFSPHPVGGEQGCRGEKPARTHAGLFAANKPRACVRACLSFAPSTVA